MSLAISARRSAAPRPRSGTLADVAVAVVAFAGSRMLLSHGGISPSHPGTGDIDLLGTALVACSTLPVVAWRRVPFGVVAMSAAAGVALAGLGYRIDLLLGPAVAIYLFAASRGAQVPWTRRNTGIIAGLFMAYLAAHAAAQRAFPSLPFLHTGLAWSAAWFAGERARLLREHIAELKDRALRAEREGERERELAAAEERARIARDLHDSAGHAINVIAVRAGAARLRHQQEPERSLAALEAIETLARQTAGEIDQIVGTLRERDPGESLVEVPPGIASVGALIARHAAAGLDVTIDVSGSPALLGVAADQAAYRILQEALTNAARHGAGSAKVSIGIDQGALEIAVTNPCSLAVVARSGGGHGLTGMRERATLLGGTLAAGRDNGGFHLRVCIPDAERGS